MRRARRVWRTAFKIKDLATAGGRPWPEPARVAARATTGAAIGDGTKDPVTGDGRAGVHAGVNRRTGA